jgi:hypothetical protein
VAGPVLQAPLDDLAGSGQVLAAVPREFTLTEGAARVLALVWDPAAAINAGLVAGA